MFVRWNVDLIKLDSCGLPLFRNDVLRKAITSFRKLLNHYSHRRVRLTNCRVGCMTSRGVDENPAVPGDQCVTNPTPVKQPGWCLRVATQMRVGADIKPCYFSVMNALEGVIGMKARYGALPDSDFLEVGNTDSHTDATFKILKGYIPGGLTADEEVTHLSLWSITSNPLVLGTNLNSLSSRLVKMMKNQDMIAVNQKFVKLDRLGAWDSSFRNGNRLVPNNTQLKWAKSVSETVWYKPLPEMRAALVFHNRNGPSNWTSINFDIGTVPRFAGVVSNSVLFDVKDVWSGDVFAKAVRFISIPGIAPHACRFFIVYPHV